MLKNLLYYLKEKEFWFPFIAADPVMMQETAIIVYTLSVMAHPLCSCCILVFCLSAVIKTKMALVSIPNYDAKTGCYMPTLITSLELAQ